MLVQETWTVFAQGYVMSRLVGWLSSMVPKLGRNKPRRLTIHRRSVLNNDGGKNLFIIQMCKKVVDKYNYIFLVGWFVRCLEANTNESDKNFTVLPVHWDNPTLLVVGQKIEQICVLYQYGKQESEMFQINVLPSRQRKKNKFQSRHEMLAHCCCLESNKLLVSSDLESPIE